MRMLSAISLSLAIITGIVQAQSSVTDPGYNCTPSQSCWPTASEWSDFNSTLNGRLHITVPFAAPCYLGSTYNFEECENVVVPGYKNFTVRSSIYGVSEALNWERCGNSGCTLQSLAPWLPPLFGTCSLGRLASYYVDASSPDHVSAAINFATAHNLRLSIKNTGHDYFGRGFGPNTLAIWTHNLNNMTFHKSFTAYNCPSANGQNIGEMGAGVQASDAYEFFGQYNMDVTGGNEGSVGLAGGFGQGGGHGIFGPSYGLMVDNAVEFDVVTADGQQRTINRCNDPDLFWAMRGGGGGTYAVLTAYRFQLHPAVPINVYTYIASFPLLSQANALQDVLTAHVNNQTNWSNNNVSGHSYYFPGKVEIYLVLPSDDNGAALKGLTSQFQQYLTNYPGMSISQNNYTTYATYSDFLQLTESIANRLTPTG